MKNEIENDLCPHEIINIPEYVQLDMRKLISLVEENNINERQRNQQEIDDKSEIKQLRIEKQDRKRRNKT